MSSREIHEDIMEYARGRVGRVLRGKYSLNRLVGVGGMAAVYSATHTTLGTTVAIKMLHPQVCVSADSRRRFRREGRVANAIAHPGAVRVIDDDVDDDGTVFLVMELLTGANLDRIWEENGRKLPVEVVLNVAGQILDVLGEAHAKGIIHRDVKPENIFITESGDVKLVDFGVARMRDMAAGSIGTRIGVAIGTPGFMSPEQALGKADQMDAVCDVYAVGAVMFSLLSGRYIHEAENPSEALVLAATQQAPSLASVAPHVPASVVRIVDKALRFQRAERWQSAERMRQEVLSAHQAVLASNHQSGAPAATPLDLVAPHSTRGRSQEATSASLVTPSPQSVSMPTPIARPSDVVQPSTIAARRALLFGALGAVVLGAGSVAVLFASREAPDAPAAGGQPAVSAATPVAVLSALPFNPSIVDAASGADVATGSTPVRIDELPPATPPVASATPTPAKPNDAAVAPRPPSTRPQSAPPKPQPTATTGKSQQSQPTSTPKGATTVF